MKNPILRYKKITSRNIAKLRIEKKNKKRNKISILHVEIKKIIKRI